MHTSLGKIWRSSGRAFLLNKPNVKGVHKMKICIALLALAILATSHVAFADLSLIKDKNFRTCVEKSLKKQKTKDVSELQKLKCHNDDIKTVEGVGALVGLKSLSLFGNDITEADLSMLSGLEHLNLAKNKLVTLNIQGLSSLETLFLFKNSLTKLNLEGLSSLKKMRMMQNTLTELDISPLVSLEQAYLWDNQLEDLQITGLDKLSFLDVKQNPMPDELYDFYDKQVGITISHDGNADDWN